MHNPQRDTAGRSGEHRRKGEGPLLYQRVTRGALAGRVTAYISGWPLVAWDEHPGCERWACRHAVSEGELRRCA